MTSRDLALHDGNAIYCPSDSFRLNLPKYRNPRELSQSVMIETGKLGNIIFILIGTAIIGRSLLLFSRHQFIYYNQTDLGWASTIVMFFSGAWCFAVGVLGLHEEKRKGKIQIAIRGNSESGAKSQIPVT
jgi:hypothetical protein